MNNPIYFFDLDGTLTDPFEGVANGIEFALRQREVALPPRAELKACIGPPLHVSFGRLLNESPEAPATWRAIECYREYYAEKGIFENVVYEGIVELLDYLSCRAELYVATSKPQPFAEHVVEHFEIKKYFKGICGSELDGGRSDKAEIMAKLVKDHDLAEREIVMVGDRCFDMEGAKKNGFKAVGVLWGYGTREELLLAGADEFAESPVRWLKEIRGY